MRNTLERAKAISIPYHLCKPEEWYNRHDIYNKLEEINLQYTITDQTFFYWIRKLYKGTFKKQNSVTYYQGEYINPVLDALIAFKGYERSK